MYLVLLYENIVRLDYLATFVDAVVKSVAVTIGALWALNRYFVSRIDVPQLRVDADISVIPSNKFGNQAELSLLIYRLDIVNTGKALIPSLDQFLEIEGVFPSSDGIQYSPLYRWPSTETHPTSPIEPGSWNAINDAVAIPRNIQAVRFYLDLQLNKRSFWSWHKTFDITSKAG